MKKTLLFTVCLLALAACNKQGKGTKEAGQERDSLLQVIGQKDSETDELVATINEILEGFDRINKAEGRVTVTDADPEAASTRETIRENMAYIEEAMSKNRELIAQLEQKLRTSGSNVSSLQTTLSNFRQELQEKDSCIQELRAQLVEKDSLIFSQQEQITDLSSNVTALTEENKQKTETVASQDKELNTAWFVFGTKAELKEQKILTSGDVLRSDDFNKNYFTQVDIRTMKEINLYSKKAEVLTSHPEGSYTLRKNSKGEYVLNITNYKKFWSVSKFLVILVK
ncbi:MAG: hypothetical protein LUC33_05620 [Prevotellaceae bacterium]|nr:hypothetical protein [Prevotellaceae bacterium]